MPKAYYFCLDIHGSRWKSGSELRSASNACRSKSTICQSCLESSLHTELRCRIKVIIKCLLEYVNAYKYQEQSLCILQVNSYENADLASRHQQASGASDACQLPQDRLLHSSIHAIVQLQHVDTRQCISILPNWTI